MKNIFILLLSFLLFNACGNKDSVRIVSFEMYSTSQYCGGAPPPDEVMEELNTPVKMNDTLYIRKDFGMGGEELPLILENGKGKVAGLQDGSYFICEFSLDKIKPLEMSPDPMAGCLMEYYKSFLIDFELKPETSVVKDTVLIRCNPCMEPAQ